MCTPVQLPTLNPLSVEEDSGTHYGEPQNTPRKTFNFITKRRSEQEVMKVG